MSSNQYTITVPPPNGVKSKPISYKANHYTIINYTPENTDKTLGIYRSVIVDTYRNHPLSFSPVKSITYDDFNKKYPTLTDEIQINEIIEGTMINVFYDPVVNEWEIATKSAIGGHCRYFRDTYGKSNLFGSEQKTFREMFYDALRADSSTPLSDIPFIRGLSKKYSYCFVLQHPENHFVHTITNPIIFLVSIFEFSAMDNPHEYGVSLIPQTAFYEIIPDLDTYCMSVDVPIYMSIENWKLFRTTMHYTYEKGYMITNIRTGERTKVENPEYNKMKELRGNHPNLQYQYFVLLRMGKVREFLTYFPMYNLLFSQLYRQYHTLISDVHQAYVSYYIHKKIEVPIPKKYFIHIANLHHNVYIPSLSTTKVIIKHRVVREYFDNMKPSEILYFLHYDELR